MENKNKQTWSSKEHLFYGIWVYRNVLKKDLNLIDRLENTISEHKLNWNEAYVGYKEKMPEYRDCFDFKIKKLDFPNKSDSTIQLDSIWQDVYDNSLPATEDYCNMYNIKMQYWEAMNFVKYGTGQHFQEHADHGFSYVCTVSLVGYPNDDYEGGELYFPNQKIQFKPKRGAAYFFPGDMNFIHGVRPVLNGCRYTSPFFWSIRSHKDKNE